MTIRQILLVFLFVLLASRAWCVDPRLQQVAENALAQRRGAVVVLSLPDRKFLASAGADVAKQPAPPGSIFKLVTAYAALTQSATTSVERIQCTNLYQAGSEKLPCIKLQGHGSLNIREAIAQSCNVYFYTLGNRLGARQIETAAKNLGWINQPLRKAPNTPSQVALFAVGEYSELKISPIQAANLAADIALQSKRYSNRKALKVVREGMEFAVGKGTATASRVPGIRVAGKTGTPGDLRFPDKTHAWFIGYAPADKPRVAIAVFVARGFGFDTAAPIAGKVLSEYFRQTGNRKTDSASPTSRYGNRDRKAEPVLRIGLFRRVRTRTLQFRCLNQVSMVNPSSHGSAVLLPGGTRGSISLVNGCVEISVPGKTCRASSWHLQSHSVECALEVGTAGYPLRCYRGKLIVRIAGNALLPINEITLENYVDSVLPGEMPPEWPQQALRSQAVIARTYALAGRNRHRSEGYDLCDLTHCQVYRGRIDERFEAHQAVTATRGMTLRQQGQVFEPLYHSTCGGKTAAPGEIWLDRPNTRTGSSVVDVESGRSFCRESPHFRWTAVISSRELLEALSSDRRTAIGNRLNSIRVIERSKTGRVISLQLQGETDRTVNAELFWTVVSRKLGWGKIKSTAFDVTRVSNGFKFKGRGLGHGVGLCQWGARGMAQAGYNWQQILRHYYPGVEVFAAVRGL